MPSFPVRLANEIFRRCLEYIDIDSNIILFDPCCGGGYMLTVLGLLNPHTIGRIICTDIDEEAISLAKSNLSLLTIEGLLNRRQEIKNMIIKYNKQSHIEALKSTDKFIENIKQCSFQPDVRCLTADALNYELLYKIDVKPDIVIADVPYGNLVSWSNISNNAVNLLLDSIYYVLHTNTVIAIIYDKSQRIRNEKYKRLERFKAGKRIIEILKMAEVL